MKLNVGELKKMLEIYSDDTVICFEELEFQRLKTRGDKLVQMELNKTNYKDKEPLNLNE